VVDPYIYHSWSTLELSTHSWSTLGLNIDGQCGLGGFEYSVMAPARVSGELEGRPVVDLSAGLHHSLAVDDEGAIFAFGQVPRLTNRAVPQVLLLGQGRCSSLGKVQAVSCGHTTSAAVTQDGRLFVWGQDWWPWHVALPLSSSPGSSSAAALAETVCATQVSVGVTDVLAVAVSRTEGLGAQTTLRILQGAVTQPSGGQAKSVAGGQGRQDGNDRAFRMRHVGELSSVLLPKVERFRSESLWAKQERRQLEAEHDRQQVEWVRRRAAVAADAQVARAWESSLGGAAGRTQRAAAAGLSDQRAQVEAEVDDLTRALRQQCQELHAHARATRSMQAEKRAQESALEAALAERRRRLGAIDSSTPP
jgi:hypothetical protein